MVDNAICIALSNKGYRKAKWGYLFVSPRKELDLFGIKAVRKCFEINKPRVVIIAAEKVGEILANSKYLTQLLLENLKIQNNLIENSCKQV